ncbi:DNA polymerase III subunit alpha [Calothrix sp. HK-06]|nr:DNA polymerase III subunit alpha [Calothrix sp. HK-06]
MSDFKQQLPQMNYFKEEDILHLLISEEPESASIEISPNVTAELNAAGDLIGVEILNASNYIRDFILESVQGKLLNLVKSEV